jgi:hypothetical protein
MSDVNVEFGIAQVGVVLEGLVDEVNENGVSEDVFPQEVAKGSRVDRLLACLSIGTRKSRRLWSLIFFVDITATKHEDSGSGNTYFRDSYDIHCRND